MSTSESTIISLEDQLAGAGVIRSRKMFGEYTLYCDEKVVALVCDDRLYVKQTDVGSTYFTEDDLAPPYPGARNYYRVPEERLEDREWLVEVVKETAHVLPLSKRKSVPRG